MELEFKKDSHNNINGHEKVPKNGLRYAKHSSVFHSSSTVTSGKNSTAKEKQEYSCSTSSSDDEIASNQNGSPPGWVFKHYRRFGQYWNVFPKTDYTYAQSSPYNGRAIAPGIPVVPNMSRPGIKRSVATSLCHHFLQNVEDEVNGDTSQVEENKRSGLSKEILQNMHNNSKHSTWEMVKNYLELVRWYVYSAVRTVTTVIYTTFMFLTTTGVDETMVSDNTNNNNYNHHHHSAVSNKMVSGRKGKCTGGILDASGVFYHSASRGRRKCRNIWLWLLPLICTIMFFYYKRDMVEDLGVDSSYLSPMFRLGEVMRDSVLLAFRSLAMLPTILVEIFSLIWSIFTVPFQGLAILMNRILSKTYYHGFEGIRSTYSDPPIPEAKEASALKMALDEHDLRRLVKQVLEEEGVIVKSVHEDTLFALDSKLKFTVGELRDKIDEAVAEARAAGLEAEERARGEALASLRSEEGWAAMAGRVEKMVAEAVAEKHGGMDSEVRRAVGDAMAAQWDSFSKQSVVTLDHTLSMWKADQDRAIQKQFKLQLDDWQSLIDKMEGRISELEIKLAGNKNLLALKIEELRKSTLSTLQGRLHKLESLIETSKQDFIKYQGDLNLVSYNGTDKESDNKAVSEELKNYIVLSITKILSKYHADRTALPDYALQSSGGYVVSIRCTNTYPIAGRKYLFGIPLWDMHTSPDTILKPGIMPGECWAFVGSEGYVVIKLAAKVRITAFTMEHMPKQLAIHGHIKSAPKDFSVWGLKDENDDNPVSLGSFKFLDNGESLQQFSAEDFEEGVDMIELKIKSNQGHPDYTCLYRFRVHGLTV